MTSPRVDRAMFPRGTCRDVRPPPNSTAHRSLPLPPVRPGGRGRALPAPRWPPPARSCVTLRQALDLSGLQSPPRWERRPAAVAWEAHDRLRHQAVRRCSGLVPAAPPAGHRLPLMVIGQHPARRPEAAPWFLLPPGGPHWPQRLSSCQRLQVLGGQGA